MFNKNSDFFKKCICSVIVNELFVFGGRFELKEEKGRMKFGEWD